MMFARFVMIAHLAIASFPAFAGLHPCADEKLPAGSRCGTVTVPMHHDAADEDVLNLHVIILPALNGDAEPDPIFVLAGGPGLAATDGARFYTTNMKAIRSSRDLVFVDLRGTGKSGDFDCEMPLSERRDLIYALRSTEGLARCADMPGKDTLRTSVFARDIDLVRQAIGAEKINLVGGSYGTRLALEYARLFPDHVRASVLRGVTSPDQVLPVQINHGARQEFAALARSNPGFAEAYTSLTQKLEVEPVHIRQGESEEAIVVTRPIFEGAVRFLLYDPRTAQALPAIVAATVAGKLDPLTRVIAGSDAVLRSFSVPVLLGVICSEDLPFWPETDDDGVFDPASMRSSAIETCSTWSVSPVEDSYKEPVRSKAPTLLFSGEHDPATPPDLAAEIASHLESGIHLVTPGIGHYPTWTSCHSEIMSEFFDRGTTSGVDTSCASEPWKP